MDAWIIKKFSEYYPKELGKGGELFKLWLLNESNPDGQKPYTEPEIRRVVNIQLQNLKYGASSGLKPNQCADILVYHASRREAKRLRRAHAATKPPLTNEQSKKDVSQTIPTPSAKEATPKPGEAPQPRIIRITRSSVYQEANSAKPTPSAEEATPGPGEAPQPRILRITRSSVRQEANSKDEKQTPKSPEQNPTSGKERVEGGSGVPRSIIARNQGILEDFVEVRRRASLEEQQVLLSLDDCVGENATTGRLVHELRNAPIFAANVLKNPLASETVLPQFGLLGSIRAPKVKEHRYGSDEGFWSPNRPDDMTWASTLDPLNTTSQGEDDPWGLQDEGKGNRTDEASDPTTDDPRVFLNTNIPISAFICGVQGSGKSHTLSCILENALVPNELLGPLRRPLSALVFHYSKYSSESSFHPCEAAYLGMADTKVSPPGSRAVRSVTVLVSPSNYHSLRKAYSQIEGVTVYPLRLREQDLNISTMLALMSVDQTESPPLYIHHVVMVLREMAVEDTPFRLEEFKRRILRPGVLSKAQIRPLLMRLGILESFLETSSSASEESDTYGENSTIFQFIPGTVTIVDLSCPFVDESTACLLFDICLGIYISDVGLGGKIVALDEAHKFMVNTPSAKTFTESLISIIRLQRHYGIRVLISTQEPTISPRLIDLCSVTIVHRFTSPEWFNVLIKHISLPNAGETGESSRELFQGIVALGVGEAYVFAPLGFGAIGAGDDRDKTQQPFESDQGLYKLNMSYLKIRIRKRLTWDGGRSIEAVS